MKQKSSIKPTWLHSVTFAAGIALMGAAVSAATYQSDITSPPADTVNRIAKAESADGTVIFTRAMSQQSEFDACTLLTDNGDTNKWKFYKYGPYIRYNIYASDGVASDSYIFIPGASLKADKEYSISIAGKKDASNDAFVTTMEFCVAPAADIASTIHISTSEINTASFQPVESERFSVPATGTYFIVLHANSPKINASGGYAEIHAKDITVTEYEKEQPPVSDALPLPYSATPTLEEMGLMSVLDNNGDEFDRGSFLLGVWNYDMQREQLVYYYSNTHQDADDYVFLPQLQFNDTQKAYKVKLDAMCASSRDPESFALYIGKTQTPSEMRCFYESGDVTNDEDWLTHEAPVGIQEKGDYYVAIKATSPKDRFKLNVKNISVTQMETSSAVPQAPSEAVATAAAQGALNTDISFKLPSLDIAGRQLSGTVSVEIASSEETKTITGQPGESKNTQIATRQGNNAITLTASNDKGTGNRMVVNVYTGVDIPRIPMPTSSVSEDNLTMHIEWPRLEEGLNGGYVDPETVVFTISRYDPADKTYDDGIELTGKYSYDYTVEAASPQHKESFIITARNIAGHEEGSGSTHATVGKPYQLPMEEMLANGKQTFEPLNTETPDAGYLYSADFRLYDLATIFEQANPYYPDIMAGHSKALWAFVRYGEPGKCRFALPKFSTEGVSETKFKMNVFINNIFPETDVYAVSFGMEPVKLGTITKGSGEGWTDVKFLVPASLGGKKWVKVYFDATFTDIDNQNIFISSYSLSEQLTNYLAVISISGPEDAINIGDKGEYTAIVRNEGKNNAAAPALKFDLVDKLGETTVSVSAVADKTTLAPEETAVYTYTIEATADNLGEYTLRAYLPEADENPANDSREITVNIIRGQKPVVNDLAAEGDDNSVTLTWSKPDIKLTGLDSFEDYEPFAYGKYIGLFKNLDLDGKKTYSYDQCQFEAATLPKAFMVINPEYLNNRLVGENYVPRSGEQYLVAFCPADGSKADDWLISPEVKAGTVVSFYITTVALNDFAERVEFCYSSTTNEPSEFKTLEQISVSGLNWIGKAFVLPDDAKYFAIHYVSADVFGIMIDDIDFTPIINKESIFTYNVYADGDIIGEGLTETRFVHSTPANTDCKYNVTAVVDGIEYSKSNTATAVRTSLSDAVTVKGTIATADGSIIITGYEGHAVMVFNTDGRAVYVTDRSNGNLIIPCTHGLYIVKAGNDVKKVSVK